VRVVIAEDAVLLREGLAGLLEDAGHEVVGRAGEADTLLALVGEHAPDLAVVDVRMPPGYDDEGTRAAAEIRRAHPDTAVLVLSQHVETRHIVELVSAGGGFGYLLKDRVLEVDDFLDAARRVAGGGSALDPQVVATLIGTPEAYDYGPERCSWLMHHLTNWMGDDGFLVSHQCRIRHHNTVGDWLTIDAQVTGISRDAEGRPLVEITQGAHNQYGDLSATGRGVVRLPG